MQPRGVRQFPGLLVGLALAGCVTHVGALLGLIGDGDPLDAPHGGADARVHAVVAGSAPFDFRRYENDPLIDQFLGATRDENPALHALASPIAHVDAGDPPIFIYQGSWDAIVPVELAQAMKAALDAARVPAELYIAGGHGHVTLFVMDSDAVTAAIDFLDRRLR